MEEKIINKSWEETRREGRGEEREKKNEQDL